MHHGDINGNGLNDFVVCYEYGEPASKWVKTDPNGGKLDWVENPGTADGVWKRHYIGRHPSMARTKLGHFTQTKKLDVLGLPVVCGPGDMISPIPVKVFSQPDDVENA